MESTIKKNKIIIILAILFGLACLSSLSAFVLTSSYSHAESTDSTLASVTVPDVCTLEDSVVGTAHTATVSVGSYTPNIGETTIKVTCNDNNGYSLYAVGYSNNTVGNTNLIGTNGNIVTGTANDGSVSNWAMKLTAVSGSFTPTILNGYDNYHIVPDTATKVATRTESIDVSSTSEIKTTYAVSISPSQAKGDYTGKVKYTVVHPNYANSDGTISLYNISVNFAGEGVEDVLFEATGYPTQTVSTSGNTVSLVKDAEYSVTASISSGYEFTSWSINSSAYGTLGSTAANPTTFIPNANSSSAIITVTGQKPKLYFQNATSADCGNIMYDNRGTDEYKNIAYPTAKIGNLCWMTRNLDLPGGTTLTNTDSNVASRYTLPESSNVGFMSDSGAYVYNSGSTTCSSSSACFSYYSYVAAVAGSNPSSGIAPYDICPKGWRLPTSGEYNNLANNYTSGVTLTASPFLGVYSGDYSWGQYYNGGTYSFTWSSSAYNSSIAYMLRFDNVFSDSSYTNKSIGHAVRCVAKT